MIAAAVQIDPASIAAVCVTLLGGALTVAWKLGKLSESVDNLEERMKNVEQAVRRTR